MYKGDRFNKESILDVRTHFKATETFQYTNFYSCHPPGVTKGFIKGEALRLLRTNSSQFTFEENMSNVKTRLHNRDYPARIVEKPAELFCGWRVAGDGWWVTGGR